MEKLNAHLANKEILAAEEQLKQITDEAMTDGHIDEDEQKQIDEAMRRVESLRAMLKPKNQRGKTEKKSIDPEGKNY
jgi:Mg2+ and Co2+ transporter CorA